MVSISQPMPGRKVQYVYKTTHRVLLVVDFEFLTLYFILLYKKYLEQCRLKMRRIIWN
ncbi:MAG: hypothetical protein AOA65_0852 [Candidatus Bathyarchaeota archaeon BA1]|nr:MAG: hypothetical protein AOA65_0852 [Candidatus Bathyarchaeota archaeon BA1]